MPIVYESAAPIGLAENIYNTAAQREAALRSREFALQQAQVSNRGGGGYDDGGMQAAINNRDSNQIRTQSENDQYNVVSAGQVFGAQAAQAQQKQGYALQAQLQQTELTQQENMRLQRVRNAVGEISADPSLSDSEKSEMIYKAKGIEGPLAHRQAMAKMAAETQAKEQQASEFKFHAATRQFALDTMGKTAANRQSFVPDVQQLAAITQHLDESLPQYPAMMGGDQLRKAHIEQMAKEEAIRQGLGTTYMMAPDGTMHPISGPGSKDHEQMLKNAEGPQRGEMTLEGYLKIHQHALDAVSRKAKETKEGSFPGEKVAAHPELQDSDAQLAETKKILRSMGAPEDVAQFHAQEKQKKPAWGYDKSKAPWAPKQPDAAALNQQPEPAQKPFAFDKPETPEQVATVANFTALDKKLKDSKAPADMRQNAIADWGAAKMLLQKKGSVSNMDADEKRRFLAAMDNIAKTVKHDPAEEAAKQKAAEAAAKPEEKAWWQGGGDYGTPGKAATQGYRYLRNAIQTSSPFNK